MELFSAKMAVTVRKVQLKKSFASQKSNPKIQRKEILFLLMVYWLIIDSLCKDELDKAEKLGVKLAEKLKKGGVMEILDKF